MAMKTLGLGLLLVAAVGGGYFLLRSDPAQKPVEPPLQDQPDPPPEEPPKIRVVDVFSPASVEAPREDRLLLPDGTWAAALNGVKNPPALDWPRDIPWSPIKDIVTDSRGQQWYRHEDGSQTTMAMMWREDLGRMDAVTTLANPTSLAEREDAPGPRLPTPPDRKN